ncbi:MAG: hypothetical protein IT204_25620, partial [Fimbriimonadaceae bacterium]|nr:hypothetical protein [Fimbriimonadaceae bacterium]
MSHEALVRCCGHTLRFEVYPPDMPPCPWEPSPDWTVGSDVSGSLTVAPGEGVSVNEISGGAGYKLYIWDIGFTYDRLYDFGINWQWGWWRQNQITHEHQAILYPMPEHYRVPVGNLDCSHGLGQPCPPGCDCPGGGAWGDLPGAGIGAEGGGAGGRSAAQRHGGPAGGDGAGWNGGRGAALHGPSQGDPVNPWNGIELYQPASDLIIANRHTAPVGFDRFWSNRQAVNWYGTPGLASGWTHNWDYCVRDGGSPGTWHDLLLAMPSGGVVVFGVQLDQQGQPTGALLPPADAGCFGSGTPSATPGEWESCEITWRDGTTYCFEPHPTGVYAFGRMLNALGQGITCEHDDDRRLVSIQDDQTQSTLLSLSYSDGYLAQVRDHAGRQVAYLHEAQEVSGGGSVTALREVSLVSPVDEDEPLLRSRFGYADLPSLAYDYGYGDRLLLLTSITAPSPNGQTGTAYIRYFDTSYRVAETEDANGNITFYYTQSDGTVTTYQLSAEGEFVRQTDITYDGNGAVTSSTCTGCATSIEYDDPNFPYLPTSVTASDGKITTYTYDSYGNLLTTTDPRDVVITNTWDYTDVALGRLVQVERTVDNNTRTLAEYTYDATTGLVLTASSLEPGTTTGDLVTTTYTYDDLGNVLTVTAPGNNADATLVTTYEYETDGAWSQA